MSFLHFYSILEPDIFLFRFLALVYQDLKL